MTKTCAPLLIHRHPMSRAQLHRLALPVMGDVLADFRTAKPGQPVGIKLTVLHRDNVMNATCPGSLMLSQGPQQEFEVIAARDALRRSELLDACDLLMYASSILQDVEGIDWPSYGWPPSWEEEYHLRELWVFPRAAVLMNNIHSCYVDDIEHLPRLAIVMNEAASSNHDAFDLARYINDLLRRTSPAAISDLVEEWPENVSEGSIPFASINPNDIALK